MKPETRDNRWIALYVLCTGMLMIVLDATIVNVALPTIQADLHFTQPGLAWVVNGYLITFGGLLLLAGRLGDLLGRRRMFLTGLAVFTAASTACGLASSQGMLIAARFIQGAGGAMTSSVILGMIVTMFTEPKEQAKAIGVFAFVASAGGAIGLLVGGVLTQEINWHWIFFVNLPIGAGTAVLARRLLEPDPGTGLAAGADVAGAALSTSALMLAVYAIVKPAPVLGIAAGVLAVAFLVRESTAATPLIPLRIFRSRNVSGANLIQVLTAAGMFGVFFLGATFSMTTHAMARRPADRATAALRPLIGVLPGDGPGRVPSEPVDHGGCGPCWAEGPGGDCRGPFARRVVVRRRDGFAVGDGFVRRDSSRGLRQARRD
jgi:MFS family permease